MAYSKMGHVVRQQPSITEHGEVIIMEATCHAEHLVRDRTARCCLVASYVALVYGHCDKWRVRIMLVRCCSDCLVLWKKSGKIMDSAAN